jgi:hypothetical protein
MGMSTIDAASKFGYAMSKSGHDASPSDVEAATEAIELRILWGTNVLRVVHVLPTQAFYVGDDSATVAECHYVIPERVLGVSRAPIVMSRGLSGGLSRGLSRAFRQCVVLLPGAHGYACLDGEGRVTLAQVVASGRALRSREIPGAYEIELPDGAEITMELPNSDIAFHFRATRAGKRLASNWLANEPVGFLYTGLSFVLHAGIVASLAFFMPRMGGDDAEALDADRIMTMQKLLNASADREQTLRQSDDAAAENSVARGGGGAAARDSAGTLGAPSAPAASHRYAVRGSLDNPDPHLQRQIELQQAAAFGAVGVLSSMLASDPDAPTAHWGRDDALGRDAISALGNMIGDTIGQAAGSGGLGLSGQELGGGGTADAIGLNDFGNDFGHGHGPGSDQGIGDGRGRPPRQHVVRSPRVVEATVEVNGRIPREVIQRVVHENFGRFRLCYENGLRGNPALQGRVVVKFTIDRTGAVAMSADGGSDLADAKVARCVVRGFGNLSFPPPGGGMVTVVYPVVLSPE